MSETLRPELFQTTGYVPRVDGVAWQALPPIVRVLLTTDGTVTKSLEAYFWEPVQVQRLAQALIPLKSAAPEGVPGALPSTLRAQLDEPLWQRDVRLVGANTQRCYAQASSLVRFQLLPEALRLALEEDRLGIGGVIRELGLETYREIIAVGQHRTNGEGATVSDDVAEIASVWRTYRLYYQQKVLMEITETFDLTAF